MKFRRNSVIVGLPVKTRYAIRKVAGLSESEVTRLFRVFEPYYQDVSLDLFRQDLSEKTHVALLYGRETPESEEELFGFSTILCREIPEAGDGIFLFSGDTVVDKRFWGAKTLQAAISTFLLRAKLRHPHRPLYWMLISKGFKTFLMMRNNFPLSYPGSGVDDVVSTRLHSKMNAFYGWKFGPCFDPSSSLIRFPKSMGAVRGPIADPDSKALKHPEVRYFVEKNPDYREGVELACIAEVRLRDLVRLMFKYRVGAKG